MKSVEVRRAINALDVAHQAAEVIVATLSEVLANKPRAHVALTGGTVGILTLEVLGKTIIENDIDLSKVHFWWGDERFVESASTDRNYIQAKKAMLDFLTIPAGNLHPFPASDDALALETARAQFQEMIEKVFGDSEPAMDLTILGMGPDGHVASLFPGNDLNGALIIAVQDSPKPPPQRLSFSMDLINTSQKILFVVAGIDKAEAFESVHKDPECELPAAKVEARGETLWIVDEAAGAAFWAAN